MKFPTGQIPIFLQTISDNGCLQVKKTGIFIAGGSGRLAEDLAAHQHRQPEKHGQRP
jgi:hypothetical protein